VPDLPDVGVGVVEARNNRAAAEIYSFRPLVRKPQQSGRVANGGYSTVSNR